MVSLHKVRKEEETVLHHLMQFYFYEFSRYLPNMKVTDHGTYNRVELDRYWNDPYHAYFIKLNEELIGFSLVESAEALSPNSIQEFFIMAKYQGNGYGKEIAKKLFKMFPGEWELSQIEKNQPAQAFWRGVIQEVVADQYKEYHENGLYIQKFRVSE